MGHTSSRDDLVGDGFLARHRRPALFAAVIVSLAVASLIHPDSADTTGGLAMLLLYLTSGTIVLRKARKKSGRDRQAWRLIGAGFVSGGVGVTLVALLETLQVPLPAFGPTDLFFLLAYMAVLAGALTLPNALRGQRDLLRVLIDGIVAAISFGVLLWVFVVDDLFVFFVGATSWAKWLGLAFPFFDMVVIVVFVTIVSRRTRYRMDPRLLLMAGGAVIQAVADLAYLRHGLDSQFTDPQPVYALFIAGGALLTAAGYLADYVPPIHEHSPRVVHALGTAAPYMVALALVGATLWALPGADLDNETRLLIAASISVGTLVVFRQWLAIRENRVHLDQKRTDLVASVSHELRTPLTAVVGVLAMMSDQDDRPSPEEMDELVALAHREANRMSRIVQDVTLLTRIEPTEMIVAETPLLVVELVSQTVKAIDTGGADIEVMVDPSLEAQLDSVRVQQVLTNLIENAGRYGRGKVTILAFEREHALVIEVHDNGPGVAKRDRSVIWERFERGAHRFDAAIPGSGIGLAVVAAIAAAHGGSASYRDSELLGGACFTLDLPGRCRAIPPGARQSRFDSYRVTAGGPEHHDAARSKPDQTTTPVPLV